MSVSGTSGPSLETKAAQNSRILAIIFSGVLQLLLSGIEEARHTNQIPCLPQLQVFINFISRGITFTGDFVHVTFTTINSNKTTTHTLFIVTKQHTTINNSQP